MIRHQIPMALAQISEIEPTIRRGNCIIFLIDTNCTRETIDEINEYMFELLNKLDHRNNHDPDIESLVAVLTFGEEPLWMSGAPLPISLFRYVPLVQSESCSMGAAFTELNSKLSENYLPERIRKPVMLCMISNGNSTDDYRNGMEKLHENIWFENALKVVLHTNDNTNLDVLKEFTGRDNTVIDLHEICCEMMVSAFLHPPLLGDDLPHINPLQDELPVSEIDDEGTGAVFITEADNFKSIEDNPQGIASDLMEMAYLLVEELQTLQDTANKLSQQLAHLAYRAKKLKESVNKCAESLGLDPEYITDCFKW